MALFTVRVLAVGQGSCNLVQYRDDGGNLLRLGMIDCGSDDSDCKDVTIESICDLMEERAKTVGETGYELQYYMDFLIVTHQDSDHLNWIYELFKNINPPEILNHVNPGRFDRRRHYSVKITYNDPDCNLLTMNRHFQLEYFKDTEMLYFAKCIEEGRVEFVYSDEWHINIFYNSSLQYYRNDCLFAKLTGDCCHPKYGIICYNSIVFSNSFSFEITFISSNIYIHLHAYEIDTTSNENYHYDYHLEIYEKVITFDGAIKRPDLESYANVMLDIIKMRTNEVRINPECKDYMLENISIIQTVVNAQLCEDSKIFSYKSSEAIENEFAEKKNGNGIGLISLLSFGGSYNPDKAKLLSKTANDAYNSVHRLSENTIRPYGINGMYKHNFDPLNLNLFPYTEQFGSAGNSFKNDSSIISSVTCIESALNLATFTGDATRVSMNTFNGSGYNSEFTNPLLMTAPHHGSISTATTKNKKGTDTSVMDEFLGRVAPERIVVSHGYDNRHGHPNLTTMNHYAECCESGKAHYCFFNTTDSNRAHGAKYRYGLTDANIFTTVTALGTPDANTKAGGKYVSYALNVKDSDISFNDYEFLKTNLLKYRFLDVCKGFVPATKKMFQARPFETTNTFLPPFIREI